jgi:hypothetical protein
MTVLQRFRHKRQSSPASLHRGYRNSARATGFVKVSQLARKGFFLRNHCETMRDEWCITHEGTQRRIYKGVQGVVFTVRWRSGHSYLFCRGVRRRLALSAIAPRLTPRQRYSWRHGYQIYSALSIVGGLTQGHTSGQFLPFTLPCPPACCMEYLPHQK